VPQTIRIDRAGGRVNHRVVLAEHVHPAARPADALQLGQHSLRFRHRLRHVPAHDEVELSSCELQLERIALLEPHARGQRCIPAARIGDRTFQDVHANQFGLRVARSQPCSDLATAAADVGDLRSRGQPVAIEQSLLLRPDCVGLRSQIAQHRLIGHLFGLGIALFHLIRTE
jgi:hypothetical protein